MRYLWPTSSRSPGRMPTLRKLIALYSEALAAEGVDGLVRQSSSRLLLNTDLLEWLSHLGKSSLS